MEAKYQNNIVNKNVKKISPFASLHNTKDHNKNENIASSSKSCVSTTFDFTLHSTSENNFAPIDQINKCFKELKIQTNIEYNEGKDEYLAGKINCIIQTLNIVLVKPVSSDVLLYFGTPLFLNCANFQNNATKYTLLGYIDDIFGSIGEPMYSVAIKCNPKNLLNINDYVYYFPNSPSTSQIYIKHKINETSNNKKYSIIIKN